MDWWLIFIAMLTYLQLLWHLQRRHKNWHNVEIIIALSNRIIQNLQPKGNNLKKSSNDLETAACTSFYKLKKSKSQQCLLRRVT